MTNINEIINRLRNDYLLGYIQHADNGDFYLMPIAWWILNYKEYDPNYDPEQWKDVFRDNTLNVDDENIQNFMNSISSDKIRVNELIATLKNIPSHYVDLFFFIDFDSKFLVSSFIEVQVKEYLPNDQWKSEIANPIDRLPNDLKYLFEH